MVSFPTTDTVASETSDWRFSGARPGFPTSISATVRKGFNRSPASFAPNKSFKPTPHRGVNSVLYATLHAVATPPWGGLTPALGGRKAFDCFAFQCSFSWLRLALLFGRFHAALLYRSSPSGALIHRYCSSKGQHSEAKLASSTHPAMTIDCFRNARLEIS